MTSDQAGLMLQSLKRIERLLEQLVAQQRTAQIERVARAICGNALSGYCKDMGEHLGCKVGRGEAFNGSNCKATAAALAMTHHWPQAEAAIAAMPAAKIEEMG